MCPALYIFQLNAKFQDMKATSQHIVYVKIKRPPLIVEIEGGSGRSVPWNKKFSVNANLSKDPLKGNNKGLTFTWRCKKKGHHDRSSCFGVQEELTDKENERKPEFREKILLEGITYQFTVNVSDDETSGTYTQEINAIPGKPPTIQLRCVIYQPEEILLMFVFS